MRNNEQLIFKDITVNFFTKEKKYLEFIEEYKNNKFISKTSEDRKNVSIIFTKIRTINVFIDKGCTFNSLFETIAFSLGCLYKIKVAEEYEKFAVDVLNVTNKILRVIKQH